MANGTISFTGTLGPGDVLIIDTKEKRVLKNGINVLDQVSIKFFDVEISYDELQYGDNEANRTIHINIKYLPAYK